LEERALYNSSQVFKEIALSSSASSKIKKAKPAAAGERKHQNTNAEAGHMIRTTTKKDCKVKD